MVRRAVRLLPDSRLAELAATGDERAFEVVYDRHHRALLGFCRHMVGSPEEAEDALQQTFLRAHRALLEHGAPEDLRPWLFTIARNRCKTLLAARRVETEVDEDVASTAGLAEEVQARADLRAVVADVAALPDDQRAALVLAELADLSHAQIAEVIGVRAEKVKALVHQARTTLIAERDAREQPCEDVREQLATARGGALRRGPLRRHLRLCAPCRAYRDAVADQRRTLALVLPMAPSAGLKAGILGAATGGGGATLGAGLATKLAATAIVIGGAGGGVAIVERGPVESAKPKVEQAEAAPAAATATATAEPVVGSKPRLVVPARIRARKQRAAKRRSHRRRTVVAERSLPPGQAKKLLAPGKPIKADKVPGSSRSPRAPAKKPHPVKRAKPEQPATSNKPTVPPGQLKKQEREALATPTPTPTPAKTPNAKSR